MKWAESWYNKVPTHLVNHSLPYPCIAESLSEKDILTLQDSFLTKGFQHIKVPDIDAGRSLVYTFVESLAVYNDIACVTVTNKKLKKNITDIASILHENGYLNPYHQVHLDDFFVDQFYFDFMWIEATDDLLSTTWFSLFEAKLLEFNIERYIPVVVLSCA